MRGSKIWLHLVPGDPSHAVSSFRPNALSRRDAMEYLTFCYIPQYTMFQWQRGPKWAPQADITIGADK